MLKVATAFVILLAGVFCQPGKCNNYYYMFSKDMQFP